MRDLICVGLTTLDVSVRPVERLPEAQETLLVESIALSPAGTAGGTALIAARLGLDVGVVSLVGEDLNGRVVTDEFRRAGVNTDFVASMTGMPTSTSILAIRPDGERPVYHQMGASVMTAFSEASIDAAKSARAIHFGGVGFPQLSGPDTIAALEAIRANGVLTSCDLISPTPEMLELLKAILPHIDIFMPSEAEVSVLLGTDVSLEDGMRAFESMGAKTCIIKRGGLGSATLIDGNLVTVPAAPANVVDTTSCGDSYCAGIIAARLGGAEAQDAMRYATRIAAKVAEGVGTLGKLADDEVAQELIETRP